MTSELGKRWDEEEKQLENGVVVIENKNWFSNLKNKFRKLFSRK